MPPETPTATAPPAADGSVRQAGKLWSELTALYDALDGHVAAAAWDDAAALAPRMRALEEALRPFVEARRAATDAGEIAAWAALDTVIESLAARQSRAMAAARAARDAIAAELARVGETRARAARYRDRPKSSPLLASRIV